MLKHNEVDSFVIFFSHRPIVLAENSKSPQRNQDQISYQIGAVECTYSILESFKLLFINLFFVLNFVNSICIYVEANCCKVVRNQLCNFCHHLSVPQSLFDLGTYLKIT